MSLSNLSISTKLRLVLVLIALALTIISTVDLINLRATMLDDRRNTLRNVVEMANSTLSHYQKRSQSGELSDDDARAQALASLNDQRYGGDNYVFVIKPDTTIVSHPIQPKLNGTTGRDIKDPNGVSLFVELAKAAGQRDGAYVHYMWNKPGENGVFPKLSYAKIGPFGWIVATGIYIDDVDTLFWQRAITNIIVALAMLAIIAALGIMIERSTSRPLKSITTAINHLADGNTAIEIENSDRRDEVGDLQRALVIFRANRIQADKLAQEQHENRQAQLDRAKPPPIRPPPLPPPPKKPQPMSIPLPRPRNNWQRQLTKSPFRLIAVRRLPNQVPKKPMKPALSLPPLAVHQRKLAKSLN